MLARAWVVVALVAVACGGRTAGVADDTGESDANDSGTRCAWPADLDGPADGAFPGWAVGRYMLGCKGNGGNVGCVSNAPDSCTESSGLGVGPLSSCVDQCNANEFAIALGAGGIGGSSGTAPPSLPAGCRSVGVNPGGVGSECCPCE